MACCLMNHNQQSQNAEAIKVLQYNARPKCFTSPLFKALLVIVCLIQAMIAGVWAAPVPKDSYHKGLLADGNGYNTLAKHYYQQACEQPEDGGRQYQGEACYRLAHVYLSERRSAENTAKAEYYLWRTLLTAEGDSQAQQAALNATLALYQPNAWHIATGQTLPRYRRIDGGQLGTATGDGDGYDAGLSLSVTGQLSYLEDVFYNGQPLRWRQSDFPLAVYVNPAPSNAQVSRFDKRYLTSARQAMSRWQTALDNRLNVTWVDSPANANIVIDWQNLVGEAEQRGNRAIGHAGLTQPVIINGRLQKMRVMMATQSPTGVPYTPKTMVAVLTHELGHALGLMGHSDNSADMMAAQTSKQTGLSKRDIATIRDLYNQPQGSANTSSSNEPTTNDNDGVDGVSDQAVERQLAGLQRQIDKAREATLNQPTWLEWSNYGKSLYNKTLVLQQLGYQPAERERLLKLSAGAFEKAVALAPNVPEPALNRVAVMRTQGQYQAAASQLESLQQKYPSQPNVYKEQVVVYAQLGQRERGRQALTEYLRLRPQDASQSWVQLSRQKLGL